MEPAEGYGPWTVWARPDDDETPMMKRDTYTDFDIACEFADELIRQGMAEAVVKDERSKWVQHVTN